MSLAFYMDVHVPLAICKGRRRRGVEVLRAQEDGTAQLSDPQLLDRATSVGRILFSRDEDLLAEATRRQRAGIEFGGVVFARQRGVSIGTCIADLELIAKPMESEEIQNRVIYVPL
jgi:predicted nuclease of predicted toxin-antitoxin system